MSKFILFILLFFGSCEKKNQLKKISVSLKSEVSTIDPHLSYDLVSNLIVYQSYEPLYQYQYLKRPYTLDPLIAKDLPQISKDGLTYTMKIKEGIPYHTNSAPWGQKQRFVEANDFVTSFKRIAFKPTSSQGWWLLKDKIVGLNEFREKAGDELQNLIHLNVKGISTPDKNTLVIKLTKPFPNFPNILAMNFIIPIPEEVIFLSKNDLSNYEYGTGPFVLEENIPGKGVIFKKFKDYKTSIYPSTGDRISNQKNLLVNAKAKLPLSDILEFKVISDNEKRWKSFLNKEIDFVDVPAARVNSVLTYKGELKPEFIDKDLQLEISPSLIFWWLSFNMRDPNLGTNKKLRQAIAMAIDIDRYLANFFNNTGRRAYSIYPPGVPGYNPSKNKSYEYSIAKAKSLLAEAGYPEGKNLPVIDFHTRRSSEVHILMAQFVKTELAKIGIVLKVIVNDFNEFLAKAPHGQMQFWQGGWLMDHPNPENILQLLYTKNSDGGPNKTGYSSKEFDRLYLQLTQTQLEENQKVEILKRLEEIVIDDVPWIITNYSINYIVKHKYLKNFRYSDLIFNSFKYMEAK
jgi:ABC-type transport system substrate-binding protein